MCARDTDLCRENGVLYIVATPIGNLKDITLRAIDTLKSCDLIAAEDTRHTAVLLKAYDIAAPMTSYFEHNKVKKTELLIRALHQGKNVALVSDAGTPGIADPGFRVIHEALLAGIRVIPIPGPVSCIAALSVSGMPAHKFVFEGFLPHKRTQRRKRLAHFRNEERTVIAYESPHRLRASLQDIEEVLGDLPVVCARELTKKFEEIRREKVSACRARFSGTKVRGEFIILFCPRGKLKGIGTP